MDDDVTLLHRDWSTTSQRGYPSSPIGRRQWGDPLELSVCNRYGKTIWWRSRDDRLSRSGTVHQRDGHTDSHVAIANAALQTGVRQQKLVFGRIFPPACRIFFTHLDVQQAAGGGKITPHMYLEFCGTYDNLFIIRGWYYSYVICIYLFFCCICNTIFGE